MGLLILRPDAVTIELNGNEFVIREDGFVLVEYTLNEVDRAYTEQKLRDHHAEEIR